MMLLLYLCGASTLNGYRLDLDRLFRASRGFKRFWYAVGKSSIKRGLVLAGVLMAGGVIGARYGAMAGRKLKAAQLRLLLALLVLGIAGRLVYELYVAPTPEYRLEEAT